MAEILARMSQLSDPRSPPRPLRVWVATGASPFCKSGPFTLFSSLVFPLELPQMAGKGSGNISLVGHTGHSVIDARQPRDTSTGLAQEEKPIAWLAEEGTHTKAALLGSRPYLYFVVLAA